MSKIARIYQGTNEIQKYYQGGVLQRLFFDWKHYIGNELNIEYAKECAGRNVVISGKTYQNLCIEDTSKETSLLNFSNYSMFKTGTYYTIILEITIDNASQINLAFNETSQIKVSPAGHNKGIYKFKVINTNASLVEISSVKLLSLRNQDGYTTCLFKNVIVLEGDYTNIDIPNSINGIESVGEREFVNAPTEYYPVTIRNYNYKCKTDGIVLPNGVKNSIDTIDGKKVHTRRVGAVLLNGTQDMELTNVNQTLTTRVRIRMNNAKISKNNLICNWFIRTGLHGDYEYIIIQDYSASSLFISVLNTKLSAPTVDGVKQYFNENPLLVFYEFATPIYTYLESGLYDDIVLPDGTKNEISYNGENHIHIRNIGKIVLDGSYDEAWRISGLTPQTETLLFQTAIIANTAISNSSLLCDIYGTLPDFSTDNIEGIRMGGTNNTRLYVRIKRSNLETEDINGFKAYLAKNPLEVYYELAEPVITELHYNDITYKLNEPLRSLPNGVCDTIEEGKIVKRVEKVIVKSLDNLNVILQEANNNRIGIKFGNENNSSVRQPIISDNFFDLSSGTSNTSGGAFLGGGRLYLTLGLSTIDKYNEWFNNNPTIFYYQLETPTETEITPDMILINGEPITDTVGIELPDGTKDIIENGYYIKRIRKVIFDGSSDELWFFSGANNMYKENHNGANLIEYRLNPYIASRKENNFSYESIDNTLSPYYGTGANYISLPENSFMCQGGYINFGCHFDTLTEFRTFLSENPYTFWYGLATPVKIPLFSIKEGLTTLKSTNNITPQIELDCLVRDDFQNLCDNIWKSGDIDLNTGVNKDRTNRRIRLVNDIQVKSNTTYRIDTVSLMNITTYYANVGARYYDISKTYISGGPIGNIKSSTYTFTTPKDCYYIRIIAETTDTNFKIYLKEVIK